MQNWIKENKTFVTIALSTIATITVVLTVLLTSVNTIHRRLDDIRSDINQRFDAQDRYIDQRFNAVDQRFDAQDKRLDSLTNEVSELRKLTVGIIERVSRNEGEIDVIRQQLQTADKPSP